MKQFFNQAFLGAIALTGAVCFSACSSKDDLTEDVNPTYDPVANTVKANLVLSFADNLKGNAKTRMDGDDIQASNTPTFKGMKNIYLIPFDCAEKIESAKTRIGDVSGIDNTIPASGTETLIDINGSKAKHYINVEVPVGTSSFLFYGVSDPANATTAADRFKYGVLEPLQEERTSTTPNPSASDYSEVSPTFVFSPVQINADNATDNATRTAILAFLNQIADASYNAGTTEAPDIKSWSAETGENNLFKQLFDKFTSLKAGSSASVRSTVQELYHSLYTNTNPMAQAIVGAILKDGTYATDAGSTGTLTFVAPLAESATNDFPGNINLPDGVAIVEYGTSAAPNDFVAIVPTEDDSYKRKNLAPISSYVFPASLYYHANTLIKVANAKKDDYYNSSYTWTNITDQYTAGSVSLNTIDIALIDQIQYAVGRMALQVRTGVATNSASANVLYDRKGAEVPVPDGGFKVTGVLVGIQKAVDFDFNPTGTVDYTIYDKNVDVRAKAESASYTGGVNHTLVLETAGDNTSSASVYIAVEFENNSGKEFAGADGVIPNGAKFYLCATLDPTAGTGVTQPSGETVYQVFKQDYETVVKLTIGVNTPTGSGESLVGGTGGLGAAYNCIPDLRTPAKRLGFSVDLSWSNGLTFEQTL